MSYLVEQPPYCDLLRLSPVVSLICPREIAPKKGAALGRTFHAIETAVAVDRVASLQASERANVCVCESVGVVDRATTAKDLRHTSVSAPATELRTHRFREISP